MGRRLPSNCRYCNAQFDLMSIIPKAEAEAKGLLKMPEEAAPQTHEEAPAAPEKPAAPQAPAAPQQPVQPGFGMGRPAAPQQPAAPAGFGMGRPAAPQQPAAPAGFGMGRPAAPQQPAAPAGFGMGRPAAPQQPAAPAGFGMGRPAAPQQPAAPAGFGMGRPAAPQQPAAPAGFGMGRPAAPQQPAQSAAPAKAECQLDFFGEKIAIPQEGGWLGRSALGAQWFKGNLLISREHVKVVPMMDGRLQIGPDKSLNGVFVTIGGAKRALDRNETAVLSAGDTLWLYNIPLQLERK